MTDTPISAERLANMYEERARFAEHEIAAIYREFVRKLRALSPPGLREVLEEIERIENEIIEASEPFTRPYVEQDPLDGRAPFVLLHLSPHDIDRLRLALGYDATSEEVPFRLLAFKRIENAIRSRLSALPESGGAATKPIASDDEHAVALARVEELMDARAGTPDGDELSALVDRVEAYEDKRWPIDAPSPDALALTDDEVCALVRERSLFVGWTCFHCGKSFSDEAAARKHFGADKRSEPACVDALAQERAGANGIAAELYALYDALAAWPKLPDGLVLRHIGSNAAGHPDDWERGKVIQRELPTGSIPFSYESEAGAGFWDRITNGEWRDDDAALRTRAKEKTDE